MDILRQLTRKFRTQNISDRSHSSSTNAAVQMKEDALDSGTGSDEEIVQILPKSRDEEELTTSEEDGEEGDEICHIGVSDDLDSTCSKDSWKQVSTSINCSPVSTNQSFSTSGSFPIDLAIPRSGRDSVTSSDYDRCSLDYEASSLSELESHSSEEELVTINRDEKRKRSQLSDDSSVFSDDDDDDDEVHELCQGRNELSFHSLSVRFSEPLGGSSLVADGVPVVSRGMSPWKRHRRDRVGPPTMHRPSLDFYKMQKTCIVRKHHSLSRPRRVKLWVVNGSQRPSKTTFDPSPFCFRSLSWTSTNPDKKSHCQRL